MTDALPPDALITLHSHVTGRTFTYRLRLAPLIRVRHYYVDWLDGHTNDARSFLLGRIFQNGQYYYAPTSEIPVDSPQALAFGWYWWHRHALPPSISVEIQENRNVA